MISLIVSIFAIAISGSVAWFTLLRPPTLVTLMTKINACTLPAGQATDGNVHVLLPILSIRNIGAKPAIITALRLRIALKGGDTVDAHPESLMTFSSILDKKDIYTSAGIQDFPVDLDKMFNGFSLMSGEIWAERYAFGMLQEHYRRIQGVTKIKIQAKSPRFVGWFSLKEFSVDFEDSFSSEAIPDGDAYLSVFRTSDQ